MGSKAKGLTAGQEHGVAGGGAPDPAAALSMVQELIIASFRGRPVRIYEAGGGSVSVLPLERFAGFHVSVVDIDPEQLRQNAYADEKILGNIETYSLPPGSVDLVVCHNVIEHLDRPDSAIRQFRSALAPGGLLFISAPNPASLFGAITKYTPHWFHVWVYRVILRDRNAGKPGQHPFPTVYHPVVSPDAFLEFCTKLGFEVVHFNKILSKNLATLQETRPFLGGVLGAVAGAMDAVTFRRFSLMLGDYHAVLKKPSAPG
jgi:SAM-dependent methyltransferase